MNKFIFTAIVFSMFLSSGAGTDWPFHALGTEWPFQYSTWVQTQECFSKMHSVLDSLKVLLCFHLHCC